MLATSTGSAEGYVQDLGKTLSGILVVIAPTNATTVEAGVVALTCATVVPLVLTASPLAHVQLPVVGL